LFGYEKGNLILNKASVDSSSINWYKKDDEFHIFHDPILGEPELSEKSSELVFDFQFINNTNDIYTPHTIDIEIEIEETWTRLKGIPGSEVLKPIGTIEFRTRFLQANKLN
jgi:hypothetical protein